MDVAASFTAADARPALRILSTWLIDAWRLFRRAPVRIFLLSLLPIVVEGLVQLTPGVGMVASKLLTPLASAWVLALIDNKARSAAFASASASRRWLSRLPLLLWVALLSATVFALQLLVAAALGGLDQALALAIGDRANLHFARVQLAVILTSGLLPAALLMFVMPRVLLDGVEVGPALVESMRCAIRYWRPVAIVTLVAAGLVAGMLWWLPLLLVLLPFSLLIGYTGYRDVFDRSRVA